MELRELPEEVTPFIEAPDRGGFVTSFGRREVRERELPAGAHSVPTGWWRSVTSGDGNRTSVAWTRSPWVRARPLRRSVDR